MSLIPPLPPLIFLLFTSFACVLCSRVFLAQVVVLTFSRKACGELHARLAEAGLKGVSCFTFHAFALRLVRRFGEVRAHLYQKTY